MVRLELSVISLHAFIKLESSLPDRQLMNHQLNRWRFNHSMVVHIITCPLPIHIFTLVVDWWTCNEISSCKGIHGDSLRFMKTWCRLIDYGLHAGTESSFMELRDKCLMTAQFRMRSSHKLLSGDLICEIKEIIFHKAHHYSLSLKVGEPWKIGTEIKDRSWDYRWVNFCSREILYDSPVM